MSDITNAIKQICEEKGLSYEAVITTIESALAAAYRKDYGEKNQNIKVEYNPETNGSKVFDIKTVVEDVPEEELAAIEEAAEAFEAKPRGKREDKKVETLVEVAPVVDGEVEEEKHRFNPKTEIQISEAKVLDKKYKVGDEIKTELETHDEYGRMAAQTAKQVIIQRLREAERDMVFGEFKDKEHEVITGFVQRREGRVVLIDLGKATGVIPPEEQIRGERYNSGERLKFYVKEVKITPRGPEIVLSRTSEEILKKVFFLEIPEISNGLVEIKGVAREAGSRSKVAVFAQTENIDPIGSCVGQRGSRIQTIIRELGGEKIDIIEFNEDAQIYIANALAPAKVEDVKLVTDERQAYITVKDDQLSLAIGKDGQNVRLAAHLTGWKIDIAGDGTGVAPSSEEDEKVEGVEEAEVVAEAQVDTPLEEIESEDEKASEEEAAIEVAETNESETPDSEVKESDEE
jgi:N utilization substance protein A